MTEESKETAFRKPDTVQVYFLTLFLMVVAVLYLWGYWTTFYVNILEYLSLTDVIRLAAYPLASTFLVVAIGPALSQFGLGSKLPVGGGRNTPVGRVLRKIAPVLVVLYVAATLWLVVSNVPNKWQFLPYWIALPVAFFAQERGFLSSVLPNQNLRYFAILMLAILPTFAFGEGRRRAEEIVAGSAFDYVLSPIESVSIPSDACPIQRIRYLGHTGDYFFFLDPTTSALAITKFKDDKTLLLRHFPHASALPEK
jgi:hypothetical protein